MAASVVASAPDPPRGAPRRHRGSSPATSPNDAIATETDLGLAAALALRVAELTPPPRATHPPRSRRCRESDPEAIRDACRRARAARHPRRRSPTARPSRRSSSPSPITSGRTRRAAACSSWPPSCGRSARSDVAGPGPPQPGGDVRRVPLGTIGRLARMLASVAGDAAWYEEGTKRLVAAGRRWTPKRSRSTSELVRLRHARRRRRRGQDPPRARWDAPRRLARACSRSVLRAGPDGRARAPATAARGAALEELATLRRPIRARPRVCVLAAALRAHAAGDTPAARTCLRDLARPRASRSDRRVVPRGTRPRGGRPRRSRPRRALRHRGGQATDPSSPPSSASRPRSSAGGRGDRVAALEEIEAASAGAPWAARLALAWASWGVEPDSARRAPARHRRRRDRGRRRPRFSSSNASRSPRSRRAIRARGDRRAGRPRRAPRRRLARHRGGACAPRVVGGRRGRNGPRRSALPPGRARRRREALRRRRAGPTGTRDPRRGRPRAKHPGSGSSRSGGLPRGPRVVVGGVDAARRPAERSARVSPLAARRCSTESRDAREALSVATAAMTATRIDPFKPRPAGHRRVLGRSPRQPRARAAPAAIPDDRAAVLAELDGILGEDAAIDRDRHVRLGRSSRAATPTQRGRSSRKVADRAPQRPRAAWEGAPRLRPARGRPRALQVRATCELGARCNDQGRAPPRSGKISASSPWSSATTPPPIRRSRPASSATRPARSPSTKLFRRVRDWKENEKLLALIFAA